MSELIEHSIPFNFEMAIGNVEADSGGKFYTYQGLQLIICQINKIKGFQRLLFKIW